MKLLELYQNILATPLRWNYYSRRNNDLCSSINNIFSSDANAREFVLSYFALGQKLDAFNRGTSNMEYRWSHTISVYLLGVAIGEHLGINFQELDERGNRKNLYLWFLTCLYHDYGYVIENDRVTYPPCHTSIRSLFPNPPHYYLLSSNGDFTNYVRWRYYDYCRYARGTINHGIIGGLMLYDQLVCHLKDILHANGNTSGCVYDGLWYSVSQIGDFERCANAIIAHNIWFNVSPIKELKLIDDQKYRYKDWLTSLLVLCDTIEPTKRYMSISSPFETLNLLSIEIEDNVLKLISDNLLPEYRHSCASLSTWTRVNVTESNHQIELSNLKSIHINEFS